MRFPQYGICDQSDQSLCSLLEYSMTVKLLTEHYLEFLSSKRGCTGSSEFTLVKMPHCWKSHVAVHIYLMETGYAPTSSHQHYFGQIQFVYYKLVL